MLLADIAMEIYAMDCALCRASKNNPAMGTWISETFVNDSLTRVHWSAGQVLAAISSGSELQDHLSRLRQLCEFTPVNTIHSRRRIVEHLLDTQH